MIREPMNVYMSHPRKEVQIPGPKRVRELLKDLQLVPEGYLVIRGQDLLTGDEVVRDTDSIEIRPVISGG